MGYKDLLIGPLYIFFIYIFAFLIRNYVTDSETRKYFFPALTLKIIGAISVGILYYFYYGGGDTVAYSDWAAVHIYDAFWDSPHKAFELFFRPNDPNYYPNEYAFKILWFHAEKEFFVIRLVALCSLFTFHTYTANACIFATVSFSGVWAMYTAFTRMYPKLKKPLAYAVLFIPSVFFWGSGILKDTITFGALGWFFFSAMEVIKFRKSIVRNTLIILFCIYVIASVKIYILLCFVPSLAIWFVLENINRIKNKLVRISLTPILLILGIISSAFLFREIGKYNSQYSVESIAETARATASWIQYSSNQQGGSTYSLGDLDFSAGGVARKAIPAIWVSLFRPHLWEVRNPVMLLTSLESTFFLLYTLCLFYLWIKKKKNVWDSDIIFYLMFSLFFSLAVGMTTYNFGSLVRYKIPMIPFYGVALILIHAKLKPTTFFTLKKPK